MQYGYSFYLARLGLISVPEKLFAIAFVLLMNIALFCGTIRAEIDDNLKGVSPSDISEWRYYGIDEEESKKWINEGINFAGWAAQWRGEGFNAESAGLWRKIANLYTAGDFLKNGFSPDEAKEWMDNGIRSGLRAREYLDAGLTVKEAGFVWKESFYPEDAKKWKDAGFDAQAMLQWSHGVRESEFFFTKGLPFGRDLYKPEIAKKWKDAGFVPNEMQRAGQFGIELSEAIKWKEAGFSFDDAVRWKDSGFTIEEAVFNRGAGLREVNAELKRYDESENPGDEISYLDIDLTLHKNGTLDVLETITIIDRPGGRYENGYFKFLPNKVEMRSLRSFGFGRTTYSNPSFHVKSIELDGANADYYVSDGLLHPGAKNKPVSEGTHYIKLSYTTDSCILDETHRDELYFGIIEDNDQGLYIRNAMVTVRLPKGADVIFTDGKAGLYQRKDFISDVQETESGDIVRFVMTRPLREHMDFAVNVAFIKGYVNEGRLHKLAQLDKRAGRILSSLSVFILGFVTVFAYFLIAWLKVGRDPKGRGISVVEFAPPEDMDPVRMRALSLNGRTDYISVTAELIYLAERGFIKILEQDGLYTVEKVSLDANILPTCAKSFYDVFFHEQNEVHLMRRKKNRDIIEATQRAKVLMKEELMKNSVSNLRYLVSGIILSLLSIGASLAIIDYGKFDNGEIAALIGFYGGFLVVAFGILGFIFMKLLRSPKEEYVRICEQVENYKSFLRRNFAGREAAVFMPPFLHESLSYAIAAGIDVHDLMIRNGEAKWYQGTSGGFGCSDFMGVIKKIV